jgi:peptidyl-prolyl cis-trans isomerase A (cyclophilin A)
MTNPLFERVRLGALTLTIACSGVAAMAQDGAPAGKPAQDATEGAPADAAKLVFVQMKTNQGDILLELDQGRAPVSVANFLAYVKDGFYDGTIFHRVINGFMIQGGGFTEQMQQKSTKPPISNEWQNGLKNKTGAIAMARTNNPNSATAQFFINVKDNDFLSTAQGGGAGYAVFGKVVAGMDVVNKIKAVQTGNKNGMQNVPVSPIVIQKTMVVSADDAKKIIAGKKDKTKPAAGG